MKYKISFFTDLKKFLAFLLLYTRLRFYRAFSRFELLKNVLVDLLYKKRGRYARPFLHFGTISILFLVVTFGPIIFKEEEQQILSKDQGVLQGANAFTTDFYTLQAEEVKQYRGGEVVTHIVQEGETIAAISQRYGLSPETVYWENSLTSSSKIKAGQELKILPLDGVRHKVKKGETIFSIGKRYGLEDAQTQAIIDYPFNEFLNDETFELAVGQWLVIPGGIMPKAVVSRPIASTFTPDAGAVTALGKFVWPGAGRITQGYSFYHKAIDIANKSGGPILAADSGTVIVAGWVDNSGYGNRVIIDHGNGFVTLYGHLSTAQVRPGQRVNRGDVIGQMGNTGRSTGTHLHFEIRTSSALLNPLTYLN